MKIVDRIRNMLNRDDYDPDTDSVVIEARISVERVKTERIKLRGTMEQEVTGNFGSDLLRGVYHGNKHTDVHKH